MYTTASLKALNYKLCCKSRNDDRIDSVILCYYYVTIMLLIKYNIHIISETPFLSTNCDVLMIKLQFNNNIIHILLTYRPPK